MYFLAYKELFSLQTTLYKIRVTLTALTLAF